MPGRAPGPPPGPVRALAGGPSASCPPVPPPTGIADGRVEDLLDWHALGREADLSVPTPEHYLPLLYVLGARRDGDVASFHNVGYFGTVSMTSVLLS